MSDNKYEFDALHSFTDEEKSELRRYAQDVRDGRLMSVGYVGDFRKDLLGVDLDCTMTKEEIMIKIEEHKRRFHD